jgi:hypothetical protein
VREKRRIEQAPIPVHVAEITAQPSSANPLSLDFELREFAPPKHGVFERTRVGFARIAVEILVFDQQGCAQSYGHGARSGVIS